MHQPFECGMVDTTFPGRITALVIMLYTPLTSYYVGIGVFNTGSYWIYRLETCFRNLTVGYLLSSGKSCICIFIISVKGNIPSLVVFSVTQLLCQCVLIIAYSVYCQTMNKVHTVMIILSLIKQFYETLSFQEQLQS